MNAHTYPHVINPDPIGDIRHYIFPDLDYPDFEMVKWPHLKWETKDKLYLLSERLKFISQLQELRKDIHAKHRFKIEETRHKHYREIKENLFCEYLGYNFNGTHYDIEALIIYLLIICIDTISGQTKFTDPFKYIIQSAKSESIAVDEIKKIKEDYREKHALTRNFRLQFTHKLSQTIKSDWLESFIIARTLPIKLENGEISKEGKICDDDLTKWNAKDENQKIRLIAEELFSIRSKFTHTSIRNLLRTLPVTHSLTEHPRHLVKIGKRDLDALLTATIRDLAEKMVIEDYYTKEVLENLAQIGLSQAEQPEFSLYPSDNKTGNWKYAPLVPKKN